MFPKIVLPVFIFIYLTFNSGIFDINRVIYGKVLIEGYSTSYTEGFLSFRNLPTIFPFFLAVFLILYLIFTTHYTIIESFRKGEINYATDLVKNLPECYFTASKAVPGILASLFVFLARPNDSLFYYGLSIALLLCALSDIIIERGFLKGMLGFTIAQGLLIGTYIIGIISLTPTPLGIFWTCISAYFTVNYIILFLRYLQSSEKGLGSYKLPVFVYCVLLGTMLTTAILLWVTSNSMEPIVIVMGGMLFILSDSVIAIREFHHKVSYSTMKVMVPYYAALGMIALGSITVFV